MEIKILEQNGITIVSPDSDIDLYNVSKLRVILDGLHENRKHKLIIDLKDVDYIDSSGLSVFIKEMARLKKVDQILKIVNISEAVEKLFRWTTANMYLEKYASLELAILSFEK